MRTFHPFFLLVLLTNIVIGQPDTLTTSDVPLSDELRIAFVGNTDFMKAYSEGAPLGANAGLGMILYKKAIAPRLFQEMEIDISLNIAQSDTLLAVQLGERILNRSDFGNYLLLPQNTRQSANFQANIWFGQSKKTPSWTKMISGLHFKYNVSNVVWHHQKVSQSITGTAFRAGVFHEFIPPEIRQDKNYSLTFGINYSFRGISADRPPHVGRSLHEAILCDRKTRFHGMELTFGFKLKNIRAEVQVLSFPAEGCYVPGLTRRQLVTSLSFVGGFPIFIK